MNLLANDEETKGNRNVILQKNTMYKRCETSLRSCRENENKKKDKSHQKMVNKNKMDVCCNLLFIVPAAIFFDQILDYLGSVSLHGVGFDSLRGSFL